MLMKLEGEYTFNGSREEVWKIFRDPDILVKALPGTKSLKQISENEYEGELLIRIGPIMGTFGGKLTVSNEIFPESLTLTVEGKGKIGFVKGAGDVNLIDQSNKETLIQYSGDIQIGGKVASVGQRLFDTVSKGMIKQGLDKLNEILQTQDTKI
jgi:carbon monoxide dehydrogenase subunit G